MNRRILSWLLVLAMVLSMVPSVAFAKNEATAWTKTAFDIDTLLPVSESEFEGLMMPVPHDADRYLRNLYGDWRKLPTEDQIRKAIHCQEYKEEIFGKE